MVAVLTPDSDGKKAGSVTLWNWNNEFSSV